MKRIYGIPYMLLVLAVMVAGADVTGCNNAPPATDGNGGDDNIDTTSMSLTSSAFADGGAIPVQYTGEGSDDSPPLSWTGAPAGTAEFALIMDDPDAPGGTWVHWVLYSIPASASSLPEGIPAGSASVSNPAGALQGTNSWPNIGYGGPMPPEGDGVHNYKFKLYALDTTLNQQSGLTKDQLLNAMDGHILAMAELTGTYER